MAKRCPKCGYTNPSSVQRCRTCTFPLTQTCPRCGTSRSWTVERCPKCSPRTPDTAESRLFTQLFQSTPYQKLKRRYSLKSLIARSRISAVYRVVDTQAEDGVSYALKEISDTVLITAEERREARRAFTQEVERWARLEHPNLPRVVDFFSSRGKHYVVMTLVRGWSLAHVIAESSLSLSEEVIRNWGAQLCDVLDYLHRQDPPIFFPDLRPRHVMVTRQGMIIPVDFGLTRLFLPWADAHHEHYTATPSLSSDVYALGRLLDSLIARPSQDASRQLRAIVVRATRRDPSSRFQSMHEFRRALWRDEDSPALPMPDWAAKKAAFFAQPVKESPPQQPARAGEPHTRVPRRDAVRRVDAARASRPQLRVSPRHIDLDELSPGEMRKLVVTVRNTGNRQLVGRLVSHVPWMTVSKTSFRCQPQQASKLVVTIVGKRLPIGTTNEPQALSVESDAGQRQWIGIRATVAQGPVLRVKERMLDFGRVQGEGELTRQVTIFNDGDTLLKGTFHSRVPWLRVPRGAFRCQPHRALQLDLALLTGQLPKGRLVEPSALLLDSDAGQERIEVRVWRVQPLLKLETTHLDLGSLLRGQSAERVISVSNTGDGVLRGVVHSQVPWLRVEPDTVLCGSGEHTSCTILIDTAELNRGAIHEPEALSFDTNAGEQAVSLQVEILAPQLSVSQEQLHFKEIPLGQISRCSFPISNGGSAPLQGHAESSLEWLTISPQDFVCAPGESVQLTVTADTSAFSRGLTLTLDKVVRIGSNDGDAEIGVRLDILKPLLAITPSVLDFGIVDLPEPVKRSLLVRNEGTGILNWNIKTDSLWVEIEPTQGQSEAGKATEVAVTAYGLALPQEADMAEGTLSIASDAGREDIPMAITVASPRLALDVTVLDLGASVNYAETEGSFTVFNHGLGTLSGVVESVVEWLRVEPTSFDCSTGRSQPIRVRARPEGIPDGPVSDTDAILVRTNGGQAAIDVRLTVSLRPRLEIGSSPLLLRQADPSGEARGQLAFRNVGKAIARAQVSSSTPELTLQRSVCTVKPGKQIRIGVSLREPTRYEPDDLFVTLSAEGTETRIPVKVVSL